MQRTPHAPTPPPAPAGSALAAALVVAVLLTLLVGALLVFEREEPRSGARGLLEATRSRMLAERGLDLVLARLGEWALESPCDPYLAPWLPAEFKDLNQNGTYEPDSDPLLRFDPAEPPATHPSPSYRNLRLARPADGAPLRLRLLSSPERPVTVGVTGTVPANPPERFDAFSVKVLDCASMIYVNGPRADLDPGAGAAAWALAPNVFRMLNSLGGLESVGIPGLGQILSDWRVRHARNFADKHEVERALADAGIGPERRRRVREFLTCHAWVDPHTLLPGALGPERSDLGDPSGDPNARWAARPTRDAATALAAGRRPRAPRPALLPFPPLLALPRLAAWEARMDPLYGALTGFDLFEPPDLGAVGDPSFGAAPLLQPRAPINLNTAPVEVLFAVLSGLAGYRIDPDSRRAAALVAGPGRRDLVTLGAPAARAVAGAIAQHRLSQPFRSWRQFEEFIRDFPEGALSAPEKRLILANANPNSRLAKFNPDRTLGLRFGETDKSDLGDWTAGPWIAAGNRPFVGWTTEFCFSAMGYYQVDSIGRTCAAPEPDGSRRVLAETRLATVARVYEVLRHTTQKDFEKHATWRSTTPAGAATVITYPESMADLQLSAWSGDAGLERACFARPEAPPAPPRPRPADAAHGGGGESGAGGVPEAAPSPACNHALCYDGRVGLAPRDLRPLPDPTFRADFTDGLDADFALEPRAAAGNADAHRLLIEPNDPSELFPDGVFCHETRRRGYRHDALVYGREIETADEYLRYRGGANLPAAGSLDLWVKPTWDGTELWRERGPGWNALDARVLVSAGPAAQPVSWEGAERRLVLFARAGALGLLLGDPREGPASAEPRNPLAWASAYGFLGPALAGPRADIRGWKAGTWHRVTAVWRPGTARLYVDGAPAAGNPLRTAETAPPMRLTPECSLFVGCNRFGERAANGFPMTADATLDSLQISRTTRFGVLPEDRYPSDDAFYGFTAAFRPGADAPALVRGGRLGTVSWTWCAPARGGGLEVGVDVGGAPADTDVRRAPGAFGGEGAGLGGRLVPPQSTLYYTVRFIPAAANERGFVDESPLLDDLTITVVQAPRLLVWSSATAPAE